MELLHIIEKVGVHCDADLSPLGEQRTDLRDRKTTDFLLRIQSEDGATSEMRQQASTMIKDWDSKVAKEKNRLEENRVKDLKKHPELGS